MSIEIHRLSKFFGNELVLNDVNLHVKAGELFALLGASGSGKTTLLRLIAGLEELQHGTILLHNREVSRIPAKDRCIGMVFQHYALFKHMTVAKNVEFPLSIRNVSSAKRKNRREELLDLVGLAGFGDRFPQQLSGGQRQRIALARALAHEPQVLLLDEPFGALDAKIRTELRQVLRRIQRELSLTTVFVTHDQEEAFEVADRIAILHQGQLLEVGEPFEIYQRPRSSLVATFLGAANILIGESLASGIRLGQTELPLNSARATAGKPRRVQVLIRPEDLALSLDGQDSLPKLGRGVISEQRFSGPFEKLRIRLPLQAPLRPVTPVPLLGGSEYFVDVLRTQSEAEGYPLRIDDPTTVSIRRFHVLASAALRLLVEKGHSPAGQASFEFGKNLANRLGAFFQVFGDLEGADDESDPPLDPLGSTTGSGAEGFDIAVLAWNPKDSALRMDGPISSRHHLLLVSRSSPLPKRILICVAPGEPGKADVRFAERFAWQMGAAATVLSVLKGQGKNEPPAHLTQFMETCRRILAARGVVASSRIRFGSLIKEIRSELEDGHYDLLVVGSPLPDSTKRDTHWGGAVDDLLRHPPPCPLLIVRAQTSH